MHGIYKSVKAEVEHMTDTAVRAVNIHVQGVHFVDEKARISLCAELKQESFICSFCFKWICKKNIKGTYKFVKEYMKDSDQLSYFNKLFDLTVQNLEEVDRLIESSSDNWKINRIAKVDLAVLRLSTIEILYLKDIPVSASINEAVDLAKKFSGEESGKFINGILGRVAKNTNVC